MGMYSYTASMLCSHSNQSCVCVMIMQFFCCYTSRNEDLVDLLAGTKLILSREKNIILGIVIGIILYN